MLGSLHDSWLKRFFAPPNGVDWSEIVGGSEPTVVEDVLRPWLNLLDDAQSTAPCILPFVRDGIVTGWYAAARSVERNDELYNLLNAWFGYAWLSRFEAMTPSMTDPMAAVLRDAFGSTVYRFGGADAAANRRIAGELVNLAGLLSRRPARAPSVTRPVGLIRADFDRALVVRHEAHAKALLDELKRTGRLNDENLRYLEVRLRAGLGFWPQIAHDHWLIKTLAELVLPPQILADLIEALYRTYLEPIEARGSSEDLLAAFTEYVAGRYPRLFASRRGVRTPWVVKAFLLFERSQPTANVKIVSDLADLLPEVDREKEPFATLSHIAPAPSPATQDSELADEAFDDGQYDRAFEFYLALSTSKRTLSRLITCATLIGTADVIGKLFAKVDEAGDHLEQLAPGIRTKFDVLLLSPARVPGDDNIAALPAVSGWIEWAQSLRLGQVSVPPSDASVTWDAAAILKDVTRSQAFADTIGNLSGDASAAARQAVPIIFNAFLQEGTEHKPATRPIAATLVMLIAMDDGLSQVDLSLLAQLLDHLLALGPSNSEYLSLLDVLRDVEERIGSYAHLTWSLDVAETLAIAPTPSHEARAARQQFFLLIVGQAQAFEHRLRTEERRSFRVLARDFEIESVALGTIGRSGEEVVSDVLPDLSGRIIGIYTLIEAAGARAKDALQSMFPGIQVTLNSDLVATSRLTNLAKTADLFIFAWKSSSHAAYYCVKDAMGEREPIMAEGKGTASILRAVMEALR